MDAAALSLNIDSSKVVQAANDLDRFSKSSDRAAASAGKVNFGNQAGSIAKLVASVQSVDAKMSSLISTLSKVQQAERALASANDNTAASMAKVGAAVSAADSHVIAYTQHVAAMSAGQQNANAHVLAYRDSLNKVSDGAKAATTAIKFTAREGLNASRQLADIGVTAAMGMSPLMIALQQGPQLFDILQEKAIATGTSISAVFRAAAVSIGAALLPLLPFVAAIALVVAGLAALTAQANNDSGLKKYTTAMGYTRAEVEKLNAVTVTFGDTMKAVFQVGFERIASALGISTEGIKSAWRAMLDFLITATRATVSAIYAAMTGMGYAVKRVYDNMKAGKFESPLDSLKGGVKSAYSDAQGFLDDVVKRARKNASGRQDAMASKMYDAPTTPKGGKTDAEKLSDIIRSAEAEIKAEQARAAAAGLSARAASELEQRTKLLNQIEKAKIPVTAAVTKEVERLAKAYTDAKIAADVAVAIQGVTDSIEKQRTAVNDQTNLIGTYGDELTRARIQMEMLTAAQNALPRGEALSTEASVSISASSRQLANDQINQDRNRRMETVRKDAEDAAYAMELERNGLGLTAAAALAYTYVTERLVEARRQGIDLSPAEVRAIQAAGDAYASQRHAIDQAAQGIADAREVARGFFNDWFNGIREGGNIFKSFADSVVNGLNRIIDKLLNKAINSFLDSLFSSGGGGGGFLSSILGGGSYANGGTFGTAQRFANGGAFTNSIVNTPTLFRFANGAAIGEMGEAGPEAIMPLKRGANGMLGVQASGGGSKKAHIEIKQEFNMEGVMTPSDVMAMVRQGSAAAVQEVKRNLDAYLREWDIDGAVAS